MEWGLSPSRKDAGSFLKERGTRPRGYGSAEGKGLWKESVKAHPDTVPLLGRLTGVVPSALSDLKKISGRLFLSRGSRL